MADKGGLEGVVVARSRLCSIDGQRGILIYGGYDVNDLAEHASYEEVAFLILRGHLPTREELDGFTAGLTEALTLSDETARVIDLLASDAAPMEMLRTAVSADSVHDPDKDSNAEEANVRKATRLIGAMPAMVARYDRRRRGLEPIDPDQQLGHAANFLYMLSGERPSEEAVRTFDVALILHADHEMNASTFTARVIASTLSDMHSAITGAIGALKGPLHGGANEQVMKLLMDIGSADRVGEEIRERLARRERIMGFGHRVYKVRDPRAEVLSAAADRLIAAGGGDRALLDLIREIERVTVKVLAEVKPGRDLHANVELYAAVILHSLRIPPVIFTPVFATARTAGWTAHILEQMADNRLIRPQSVYVGPRDRRLQPINELERKEAIRQ
jgi:2-methylcitrate synthase